MSRAWRFIFPCYLWCAPATLIGFVIAHIFYKASSWVWHDGVLTCVAGTLESGETRIWGRPNAQTLGWIQIYDSAENRLIANLRVHENVHVVQAFAGALLGLVFTPLLFVAAGWSPLWGLVVGGFVGGIGFAVAYGALFLYLYIKGGGGDWYSAYRANPFEVQAYDLQDKYVESERVGVSSSPWGV